MARFTMPIAINNRVRHSARVPVSISSNAFNTTLTLAATKNLSGILSL
jgi:hypothetical protein